MRYFASEEFLCRCGRPECDASREIRASLGDALDALRERMAEPLIVTSGNRCAFWNDQAGGEENSAHLTGWAVDLSVPDSRSRFRLLRGVFALQRFRRIGIGATFLHVDQDPLKDPEVVWLYL